MDMNLGSSANFKKGSGGAATAKMNDEKGSPFSSFSMDEPQTSSNSSNSFIKLSNDAAAAQMNDEKELKNDKENETEKLFKKVETILNKLTLQNLGESIERMKYLPIDTVPRLQGVIDIIHKKAIDEPDFSRLYAKMCNDMQTMSITDKEGGKTQTFRTLLINKCQQQFERDNAEELDEIKKQEEINPCTDLEKKKELQSLFEETRSEGKRISLGNIRFIGELFKFKMLTAKIMLRCIIKLLLSTDEESLECLWVLLATIGNDLASKSENKKQLHFLLEKTWSEGKRISLGNIRFIGELFKFQMLSAKIMLRYIIKLLSSADEESLECLCVLLATIGKDLESKCTAANSKKELDEYFDKVRDISENEEHQLSSRIRFMLKDVIALRKNNWLSSNEADIFEKWRNGFSEQSSKQPDSSTNLASVKTVVLTDAHKIRTDSQNDKAWRDVNNFKTMNFKLDANKVTAIRNRLLDLNLLRLSDNMKKLSDGAATAEINDKMGSNNDEQNETEKLFKKIEFSLIILTPQNLDEMIRGMKYLPIYTVSRLQGVIDIIHKKAIDKPDFSRLYAKVCHDMQTISIKDKEGGKMQTFGTLLIDKCQQQFERDNAEELDEIKKQEEINACTDLEKKKELQLLFEKTRSEGKRISLGNIRFIGELFKFKVLTAKIMLRCCVKLLSSTDEESLECLCVLLATIGKDLESKCTAGKSKKELDEYFDKVRDISENEEHQLSSRIRFMLKDVIALRKNNWLSSNEADIFEKWRNSFSEQSSKQPDSSSNLSTVQTDVITDAHKIRTDSENDKAWRDVNNFKTTNFKLDANKVTAITNRLKDLNLLGSSDNLKKLSNSAATTEMIDETVSNNDGQNETEELFFKNITSILNKLTAQNFDKLIKTVTNLPINTMARMQGVIDIIHRKATKEWKDCTRYAKPCITGSIPSQATGDFGFWRMYAAMCNALRSVNVKDTDGKMQDFRTLLRNKCQQQLEHDMADKYYVRRMKNEIDACADSEKKKDLQLLFEEKKRRLLGNCGFIGELLTFHMMTVRAMMRCITKLLSSADEESQECLCVLLITAGKVLESKCNPDYFQGRLDRFFVKLQRHSENEEHELSSRIRFMLQDVVALRKNNWVSPREADNFERSSGASTPEIDDEISSNNDKQNEVEVGKRNLMSRKNVLRNFKRILRNLTPQNIDESIETLKNLPIDSKLKMQGVVDNIYAKAISEWNDEVADETKTASSFSSIKKPDLCILYAQMGSAIRDLSVTDKRGNMHTLGTELINKCQRQFDRDMLMKVGRTTKKQREIDECTDSEKKKELQILFKEDERRSGRMTVGNCRFMGELFKFDMMTAETMFRNMKKLSLSANENSLECLFVLLATIGKDLESKCTTEFSKKRLDRYFDEMQDLLENKPHQVSSRVRFMLQDVIDSRKSITVSPGEADNFERRSSDATTPEISDEKESNDDEQNEIDVMKPVKHKRILRLVLSSDGDDEQTIELFQNVIGILNKLTPQNFDKLSETAKNLPIDTTWRMQGVIDIIHKKAIGEWKFCSLYAKLCSRMRDVKVADEAETTASFAVFLINKCEKYFENSLSEDSKFLRKKAHINSLLNQATRKKLFQKYELDEYVFRKDSVGNIQFIGELFKLSVIDPELIFKILDRLVQNNKNMAIECLCTLIKTIGQFYEEKFDKLPNLYFEHIAELSRQEKLPLRIRFLLLDVIEMKNNSWRARFIPELPKTFVEIELEFEKKEKLASCSPKVNLWIPLVELRKLCQSLFEEYVKYGNIEPIVNEMREKAVPNQIPKFVFPLLEHAIKNKGENADKCGKMLVDLLDCRVISTQDILKGFSSLLSGSEKKLISDDLEQILKPLFLGDYLKLDDLNVVFQNIRKNKRTRNTGLKSETDN